MYIHLGGFRGMPPPPPTWMISCFIINLTEARKCFWLQEVPQLDCEQSQEVRQTLIIDLTTKSQFLETTPANITTHGQNIARLQPYTHHCTCLIYFCHGDNYVCMWLMLHPWMCAGRFPKSIRFDWTHLGWILPRLWQSRKWRRVTNWFSCTDSITTCTSRGNSWVRYNLLPSILVNNGTNIHSKNRP